MIITGATTTNVILTVAPNVILTVIMIITTTVVIIAATSVPEVVVAMRMIAIVDTIASDLWRRERRIDHGDGLTPVLNF